MQDSGEKRSVGRPTIYTPELGEEICRIIAISSKGLKRLCEKNPHWPCHQTIHEWRIKVKEFGDLYAKSKQHQVETLLDEMLDIADDTSNDTILRENKDGETYEVCNTEWVNRSRLRVDTRKWVAVKLMPTKYGEKLQTERKIDIEAMDKAELEGVVNALSNEAKIKLIEIVIQQVKDSEVKNDK